MFQLFAELIEAVTTGLVAKKMQAIHCMLNILRECQQPAIIADVGGGFLSNRAKANALDLMMTRE